MKTKTVVALYDAATLEAAVAAERERCAKVCEEVARRWDAEGIYVRNPLAAVPQDGCDQCAASIRGADHK